MALETEVATPEVPTGISVSTTVDKSATAPALSTEGDAKPPVEPKPDFPDDWRKLIVADLPEDQRDNELKRLARVASPKQLHRSYRELERKVSSGDLKPAKLAEDATAEDLAAYRKAWGIPDAPDAYGITFPAGLDLTEADKADLGDFLTTAHKNNIPAGTTKAMADWYFGLRAKAEQQLYDAAHEMTINNRATIKSEFGKDYNRNVRLANANLVETLGAPDRANALVGLTLADGTKLGDHPEFIRYAVAQALKGATESDLITSDYDAAGKSVADAYEEALNLKFSNPTKYHTDEHQKKLLRLRGALNQKQTKAA